MLNFKQWFFITESKEEKALALELAGNQENYDQLLYAIPQNQKYSDPLLVLAAYYLTQSKNLNQTKQDIEDYIKLLKNNKMPLIKVNLQTKKPDPPFDNYLHWTQIIHGHQGEEQAKQARKYTPTDIDFQNEKPIATSPDGLIKVYQSNSPNQCIILGKGQSFCVSQPGNTMWKSYRDTKGSTFYFVYDHSRQDDLSIVVVDANQNGLELTDRINTTGKIQNPDNPQQRDTDPQIYMDYLKSKGINTNIFQNLPKTKEENEEDEKLGTRNEDLNWFVSLSPQEKSNYIGRGHQLNNEQFNYLWNNKFQSLIEQYVKTGLQLNDYQIDKITTNLDLKKNYIHNRFIAMKLTPDISKKEWNILSNQQKYEITQNEKAVEKAAWNNEFEILKYLIDNGSKIGEKSVEYAAEKASIKLVEYLVEKGAKIGKKAVSSAVVTNKLDVVKYLVKKGANIDDNAIKFAAGKGYLAIVKYLVEKGVNIGNSLLSAANNGHLDVVEYLVDEGRKTANELQASLEKNAIFSAAENGHLDVVECLVDKGVRIYPLLVEYAAKNGHLNVVRYLVEKGGNIGDAMNVAAENRHLDVVKYLNDIENSKT